MKRRPLPESFYWFSLFVIAVVASALFIAGGK